MNKGIVGLIVVVFVVCAAGAAAFLETPSKTPTKHAAEAFDFTVAGTNSYLRYLESNVSLGYVPLTVGSNQNWQLTINCTQMPGGSQGWTEMYIYNGYWDNGTNHKCQAGDTYPIIGSIQDAKQTIQGNSAFTEVFDGTATAQSYTVFFVFPNGGQGTFHVTYKQI